MPLLHVGLLFYIGLTSGLVDLGRGRFGLVGGVMHSWAIETRLWASATKVFLKARGNLHGEQLEMPSMSQKGEVDVDMDDRLEDMIRDIGAQSFGAITCI
ncbi:hypothetical protein L6164_037392 [Bauhinia variegata]|uniref:Uncharacterized protein n=1 Tax=Bauhinia variegata TaxID=167791 RepID=A0ACB9KJV6_BAUVA|nr:hypothetical protein L6164_037392 [Bauhinia variegata]